MECLKLLRVSLLTALTALVSSSVFAQTITEYQTSGIPEMIVAGPDGALWFTQFTGNKIGRITVNGTITEFTVPTPSSLPLGITAGPDGALWFIESDNATSKVGRITTSGVFTEFALPTQTEPAGIAAGSDNALWFTEILTNKIGRITLAGSISHFSVPTPNSFLQFIAAGPDGNLWFTECANAANRIGRITTAGTITEFVVPTANSCPNGITAGPDGAVWFTENNSGKIGRITTAGTITDYAGTPGSNPEQIKAGLDGALWFAERTTNKIGRITTAGVIALEFGIPTPASGPAGIAVGPDGAIWFTEANGNKIGKLTPIAPPTPSPLVAAVLPTSRSVQAGNTATVFASIINNSASSLTGCRIVPATFVNGYFSYQTTDGATNALAGAPNTSVPISAHGLQTFVIAYKAATAYPSADVQFYFICDNTAAAAPISGVNTLQLTFDANAVADMIAVGLTPSNDGFAHTGGPNGIGLFAVATTNIGLATPLTARIRLSDSNMPITATICETNAQAQCKAPPAATVARSYATNEAATFSIFLQASGALPPDPAKYRAFVEFVDSGGVGVVRGSTSTAVTTQ